MERAATRFPLWTVRVLSLFPAQVSSAVLVGLAGRAHARGVWSLESVDIRSYSAGRRRSVDGCEFGGGGVVLRADVLDAALTSVTGGPDNPQRGRIIHLSPRGRVLDQSMVRELAGEALVTLLCGRYEGIDERVVISHRLEEISIGDFILSGGECAAAVLIDACVRLLPTVVGNARSVSDESFESGLLEHPHYARPARWIDKRGREYEVPAVLRSGNHQRIRDWRRAESIRITQACRPDLWQRSTEEDRTVRDWPGCAGV